MLPVIDHNGTRTFSQILTCSFLLIPVSLVPTITGMSGVIYLVGTLLAGIGLFVVSRQFAHSHSTLDAKRLLKATVLYLPVLLILIVLDVAF